MPDRVRGSGRRCLLRAPVAVAALCVLSSHGAKATDSATEAVRVVTFVEVSAESVARAQEVLLKYARNLQRDVSAGKFDLLQELGRPERFVLLESAPNDAQLGAAEAASRESLLPLDALLAAPFDRRVNHDFAPASSPAAPAPSVRAETGPGAVYVITHVDIGGPDRSRADPALARLAEQARASTGNLAFMVWQQRDRSNHYNIVGIWQSLAVQAAFNAQTSAREFRTAVAPMLGAPYDSRIYRRVPGR